MTVSEAPGRVGQARSGLRHRLARLAGVAGAVAASLLGAAAAAAQTLQHGPFEIVVGSRRIGAGGFPNTSGNPFRTQRVSSFEVRLNGQRVALPGRGHSFWTVLRLEGAPQPALLVGAGPMHLLTVAEGRLAVQPLGGDSPVLQWLDSQAGQPGPEQHFGPAEKQPEADTWLRGGRLLMVDRRVVLNVATLALQPIEPWIVGGLNASTVPAVALSPRATLLAMPATGPAGDRREAEGVLVIDLLRGGTRALALGEAVPPRDAQEPHAEWFARHFEWTATAGGAEQLRVRPQPLPWKKRGVQVVFGEEREYHVRRVKPELATALAAMLRERFQAQPQSDVGPLGTGHYLLPGCGSRLSLGARGDALVLYAPRPGEPPWVRCQQEIVQIAAAFDAELAAGRHDRWLLP